MSRKSTRQESPYLNPLGLLRVDYRGGRGGEKKPLKLTDLPSSSRVFCNSNAR